MMMIQFSILVHTSIMKTDLFTGKDGFNNTDIDWDDMCLADWWSMFEHSPRGVPSTQKTDNFAELPVDKRDYELGKRMGTCKRRRERAVLRYYIQHDEKVELARALCVLFLPFRDEMSQIHKDPERVLADNKNVIERVLQNRHKKLTPGDFPKDSPTH